MERRPYGRVSTPSRVCGLAQHGPSDAVFKLVPALPSVNADLERKASSEDVAAKNRAGKFLREKAALEFTAGVQVLALQRLRLPRNRRGESSPQSPGHCQAREDLLEVLVFINTQPRKGWVGLRDIRGLHLASPQS